MPDTARPPAHDRAPRSLSGIACLLALLAAGGCSGLVSTSQSRLYALDTVAPVSTVRCPIGFSVREVRVAGHLDRDELVIARDGARVRASADDVWAAPLRAEVPRLLTRLLLARLTGSTAVPYPWRFGEVPALALNVDVDRLDPVAGQLRATLRWTVTDPQTDPTRPIGRGTFETSIPVATADPAAVVDAIDLAFGRFADALADTAGRDEAARAVCGRTPADSRAQR